LCDKNNDCGSGHPALKEEGGKIKQYLIYLNFQILYQHEFPLARRSGYNHPGLRIKLRTENLQFKYPVPETSISVSRIQHPASSIQ
jgi:hypothetical protein